MPLFRLNNYEHGDQILPFVLCFRGSHFPPARLDWQRNLPGRVWRFPKITPSPHRPTCWQYFVVPDSSFSVANLLIGRQRFDMGVTTRP